jgi:hypothetical protein
MEFIDLFDAASRGIRHDRFLCEGDSGKAPKGAEDDCTGIIARKLKRHR